MITGCEYLRGVNKKKVEGGVGGLLAAIGKAGRSIVISQNY